MIKLVASNCTRFPKKKSINKIMRKIKEKKKFLNTLIDKVIIFSTYILASIPVIKV